MTIGLTKALYPSAPRKGWEQQEIDMAQINRSQGVIAIAGLLAGLALAGIPAFAQTTAPAPGAAQSKGTMQ